MRVKQAGQLKVDDEVFALERLEEEDFNGCDKWIHAVPGSLGRVTEVYPDGTYDVQFEDSRSITLVYESEIAPTGRHFKRASFLETPSPVA